MLIVELTLSALGQSQTVRSIRYLASVAECCALVHLMSVGSRLGSPETGRPKFEISRLADNAGSLDELMLSQ
jgi:hypothetical protein